MESYEEIQSSAFISSVDNQSTDSPSISRIVVQGENSRSNLLSNETFGQLQKEGGNLYTAISTFIGTPGSGNSNSTTYLALDSLCTLPNTLLNSSELPNGNLDAGSHYVINAPHIHSLNGLAQTGSSQVLILPVPASQSANQVS